ncbi:hypothetical protein [Cerasicoccus maritimus]|uniref:hypothetical protein n=1 Tax=Cerasicoccus maritimus TaxID=490089 RepID=UPI002852A076|nr:hypothetical protein [Cerasicoccus maritimus]
MTLRYLVTVLVLGSTAPLLANTENIVPASPQPTEEVIILNEAPPAEDATEAEKDSYWERVRAKYESAKDATGDYYDKAKGKTGEYYGKAKDTTSGWYEDARDWTQDDIKKAGSWNYRVVVIEQETLRQNPAAIEELLNDLGAQRYECFWVEPLDTQNSRIAFFFKKSGFSYLKSIPTKEFWRFLPKSDDSSDSEQP